MAQGHKRVTVNAMVVGSVPIWRNEIFNIFLRSGTRKARR